MMQLIWQPQVERLNLFQKHTLPFSSVHFTNLSLLLFHPEGVQRADNTIKSDIFFLLPGGEVWITEV